eukprot:4557391-Alexandrium_andersonii.AAC.1
MLTDRVAVHGLRKHMGGVVCAGLFDECEIPGPDSLLNPHLAQCQVARPPDARATADADSSAA